MSTEILFQTHLILGYVAWLLCFGAYVCRGSGRWTGSKRNAPSLLCTASASSGSSSSFRASSAPICPRFRRVRRLRRLRNRGAGHAGAAHGRIRPLFWPFVVAFNLVGTVDLIVDYYHAIQVDLPARAGELGATYAIPIIYVPLLMITHIVAFYFLVRPQRTRLEPSLTMRRHPRPFEARCGQQPKGRSWRDLFVPINATKGDIPPRCRRSFAEGVR